MHVQLTDILSCPRCGPEFGLILLADRVENRRVLVGVLGCANCREHYTIEAGIGDLRPPDDDAVQRVEASAPTGFFGGEATEAAVRLAALLGVASGPAVVLVVGPAAHLAPLLAGLVENLEVAAAGLAAGPGVSPLRLGTRLPFYSGRLRGVALTGEAAGALLEEGMRVVARSGRLVLDPAPADAEQRLAARGFEVLAREGETVVAARG